MKLRLSIFLVFLFLNLGAEDPLLVIELNRSDQVLADFHQSLYRDFIKSRANDYFVKSKLYLKFNQNSQVYQDLSSTLFNIENLKKISKKRAMLALYNVRELTFFALLEIDQKDFQLTRFYLDRAKFKNFTAADFTYFMKTDPSGKKYFCFFFKDGLLFLSNSPAIMDSQLQKLKEKAKLFVSQAESLEEKDFDLFMRFTPEILDSPYFQSYWFNSSVLKLKGDYQQVDVFLHSEANRLVESRYIQLSKNIEKTLGLGGESIPSGDLILMTSLPTEVGLFVKSFLNMDGSLPNPEKFLMVRSMGLDDQLVLESKNWLKLEFASGDEARKWQPAVSDKFAAISTVLSPLNVEQKDKDLILRTPGSIEFHQKPLGADIVSYGFLRIDRISENSLREIKFFTTSNRMDGSEAKVLRNFVEPVVKILRRLASIEKYTQASPSTLKETVIYTLAAR